MNTTETEDRIASSGFLSDDFELKNDRTGTGIDTNFASQSYWKDVRIRFTSNKGAVISLVVILIIMFFAFLGPGMNRYTYSQQNLEQKNYAPRIPVIETSEYSMVPKK